jgi:hypothetical protein
MDCRFFVPELSIGEVGVPNDVPGRWSPLHRLGQMSDCYVNPAARNDLHANFTL